MILKSDKRSATVHIKSQFGVQREFRVKLYPGEFMKNRVSHLILDTVFGSLLLLPVSALAIDASEVSEADIQTTIRTLEALDLTLEFGRDPEEPICECVYGSSQHIPRPEGDCRFLTCRLNPDCKSPSHKEKTGYWSDTRQIVPCP